MMIQLQALVLGPRSPGISPAFPKSYVHEVHCHHYILEHYTSKRFSLAHFQKCKAALKNLSEQGSLAAIMCSRWDAWNCELSRAHSAAHWVFCTFCTSLSWGSEDLWGVKAWDHPLESLANMPCDPRASIMSIIGGIPVTSHNWIKLSDGRTCLPPALRLQLCFRGRALGTLGLSPHVKRKALIMLPRKKRKALSTGLAWLIYLTRSLQSWHLCTTLGLSQLQGSWQLAPLNSKVIFILSLCFSSTFDFGDHDT